MKFSIIGSSLISEKHIDAAIANDFIPYSISSSLNSKTAKKLSEEYKFQKYYKNSYDLIDDDQYDLLIIACKVDQTTEYLNFVKNKDKQILVEKPVSYNPSEINKIIMAGSFPKIHVGFNRRFYKTINELKRVLDNLSGYSLIVNYPELSKNSSDLSNRIASNGVHLFDIINYLCGEYSLKLIFKDSKNKHYAYELKSEKFNGVFNLFSNSPTNMSISIYDQNKLYELKPIEIFTIYEDFEIIEPTKELNLRQYKPIMLKNIIEDSQNFKPGFYEQINSIKNLIDTGEDVGLPKLQDAYFAQQIANKIIADL